VDTLLSSRASARHHQQKKPAKAGIFCYRGDWIDSALGRRAQGRERHAYIPELAHAISEREVDLAKPGSRLLRGQRSSAGPRARKAARALDELATGGRRPYRGGELTSDIDQQIDVLGLRQPVDDRGP